MTSLNNIQEFLGLEIPENKRLRDGKKYPDKNQYYYFRGQFYIVKLTQDKWTILDDSVTTRRNLRKYAWNVQLPKGYTRGTIDGERITYHKFLIECEPGLVIDHINRKKFDNRLENLRVVTPHQNMRNCNIGKNNTSGKTGVNKQGVGIMEGWVASVRDDNGIRRRKTFSINKYGNDEAFRLAVQQRKAWEEELGYLGE